MGDKILRCRSRPVLAKNSVTRMPTRDVFRLPIANLFIYSKKVAHASLYNLSRMVQPLAVFRIVCVCANELEPPITRQLAAFP